MPFRQESNWKKTKFLFFPLRVLLYEGWNELPHSVLVFIPCMNISRKRERYRCRCRRHTIHAKFILQNPMSRTLCGVCTVCMQCLCAVVVLPNGTCTCVHFHAYIMFDVWSFSLFILMRVVYVLCIKPLPYYIIVTELPNIYTCLFTSTHFFPHSAKFNIVPHWELQANQIYVLLTKQHRRVFFIANVINKQGKQPSWKKAAAAASTLRKG